MIKKLILYAESLGPQIKTSDGQRYQPRYTKDSIIWIQKMIQFSETTRNGNDFSKEEFEAAIMAESIQERLTNKRLICEMDHPPKDDFERFTQVNISRGCARINRIWFEGDVMLGEFETFGPLGNDLRAMIEQGMMPAVSFRGYGIPKATGGRDIIITTWDIVYNPSDRIANAVDGTFSVKYYSEAESLSAAIDKAIRDNAAVLEDIVPTTSGMKQLFAESENLGIIPEKVIKYGSEVLAYSFKTKEEVQLAKAAVQTRNFIAKL